MIKSALRQYCFGRRTFLKFAAAAMMPQGSVAGAKTVDTPMLSVGYVESGNPGGVPVILLHGFPDDVHAWDDVAPPLADALHLDRFAVCGFDWGGRAACIAAALHPERVRATVLIGGYTIQNTIGPSLPSSPAAERAIWYQYYFNTERGRAGLQMNRRALCRLLWETWSPTWHFTDETYNRTAASFDNPDFVDVVVHSYRHRINNAPGEPRLEQMERQLAQRPKINVPAITLYGADDGIARPAAENPNERVQFPMLMARRVIAGAGHFLPREKPEAVSAAILEVLR